MRCIIARAAITLGGIVVVALGLEIYMRLCYAHVSYNHPEGLLDYLEHNSSLLYKHSSGGRRLKPNVDVTFHNHPISKLTVTIRSNSIGLRDKEIAPTKLTNEIRILALGDSITETSYLPEESSYVSLLEKQLQTTTPDNVIEVVNAGVSDTGLTEEVVILKEIGVTLQPDHVLIAFYLNDSQPPWSIPARLQDLSGLKRYSLLYSFLSHTLKLNKWIAEEGGERLEWVRARTELDWRSNEDEFLQLVDHASFDWGAAWKPEGWVRVADLLSEVRRLADDHNFEVTIAAFPVSYQVYAGFLNNSPQQELQRLAQQFDFNFIDLLPTLREFNSQELFFDHCHLNELGNRIAADKLNKLFVSLLPE